MNERISFAKNGQWTLHKTTPLKAPKGVEGSSTDDKYKATNAAAREGRLHEDFGQKGSLHNFGQGHAAHDAARSNPRKDAKPTEGMNSVYEERNPGTGIS